MKNSARYHKLWLKKLNEYPVKENAESSWAEMQALLNEHMPAANEGGAKTPSKFSGGTIVSMLGFVLPAAAMIGAITFAAVKHPFKNKELPKQQYKISVKNLRDSDHNNDSIAKTQVHFNTDSSSNSVQNNTKTELANKTGINNQAIAALQVNRVNRNNTGSAALLNSVVYSAKGSNSHKAIPQTQRESENKGLFSADSIIVNYGVTAYTKLESADNNALFRRPLTGFDSLWGTGLIRRTAAASKATSAGGFSKITVKGQGNPVKNRKIKSQREVDFGIEGLTNTSEAGTNLVLGVFGSAPLNQKWQVNAGARIDLNRNLSGIITHPSYSRPDTVIFKVTDSRKVNTISIPITFKYKVSKLVSIHAGPQLSLSTGQSMHSNKLQTIPNYRDTASHSHSIDSALKYNSISKFNIGISGGVSIRVSPHFYFEGLYQQNITPYKVKTGLGNYNQYYHSVQLGIRYTFKREK
jgi:hypothetical protein